MKFNEFLGMCPYVSVDTVAGNTYATISVFDTATSLKINCNNLQEYVWQVKRMDPVTLARDATGKTKGKEFSKVHTDFCRIIERMKKLVAEYIDELREIAEDILPSDK